MAADAIGFIWNPRIVLSSLIARFSHLNIWCPQSELFTVRDKCYKISPATPSYNKFKSQYWKFGSNYLLAREWKRVNSIAVITHVKRWKQVKFLKLVSMRNCSANAPANTYMRLKNRIIKWTTKLKCFPHLWSCHLKTLSQNYT